MTDNVDLFADVAAALFVKLHAAFPIPVDIETDALADEAMPDGDPSGATREAFVEASLSWLANAGFISFDPSQLGARMIERVGLRAKGFVALQALGDGFLDLKGSGNAGDRRRVVGVVLATGVARA